MSKKFRSLILGFILIIGIFTSLNFVSAESLYCAEKTIDGFSCLNVPLNEVNKQFRYDQTSCESTNYCSTGTCINSEKGTCTIGPSATCNASSGNVWYSEQKGELPQCGFGCCLYGDQSKIVEKIKCYSMGGDYGVDTTFYSNVVDYDECAAMAGPEDDGACVLEKDYGRTCLRTTREECSNQGGDFEEGFLCSAQELGADCSTTRKTTCDNEKVYFIDSCGNKANIYNSEKVSDSNYWTYIQEENICGEGNSNANSKTCGNCKVSLGSTCGIYQEVNPTYGNYICRDLACYYDNDGDGVKERYESGQSWCSEPIENFENALPGQLSYRMYCSMGEIYSELCDPMRDKLCYVDEELGKAGCIINRWQDCYYQNSSEDCLNEVERDCKIVEGASLTSIRDVYEPTFISEDGTREIASCVPKYTPAFQFWNPEGTINEDLGLVQSVCGVASRTCVVPYTRELVTFYADPSDDCIEKCKEVEGWNKPNCARACTPVCLEDTYTDKFFGSNGSVGNLKEVEMNKEWVESYEKLCTSVGDCGVSPNYEGNEGYHAWEDLVFGDKIKWWYED